MPFLVQIGSMAVVMRSAAEALSQFDMYVAEGKFVSIADMDGFALDVDRIREMIAKVLPGMDVSCAARFGRRIFEVGRRRKPNTPTAFSRIDAPIAATRTRRRIGGAVSNNQSTTSTRRVGRIPTRVHRDYGPEALAKTVVSIIEKPPIRPQAGAVDRLGPQMPLSALDLDREARTQEVCLSLLITVLLDRQSRSLEA